MIINNRSMAVLAFADCHAEWLLNEQVVLLSVQVSKRRCHKSGSVSGTQINLAG